MSLVEKTVRFHWSKKSFVPMIEKIGRFHRSKKMFDCTKPSDFIGRKKYSISSVEKSFDIFSRKKYSISLVEKTFRFHWSENKKKSMPLVEQIHSTQVVETNRSISLIERFNSIPLV